MSDASTAGNSSRRRLSLLHFIAVGLIIFSCQELFRELAVVGPLKATIIDSEATASRREASASVSHMKEEVKIFHPFKDLLLVDDDEQNNFLHSEESGGTNVTLQSKPQQHFTSHRCASHGTASFIPDYAGRTCIFRNVYFQPSSMTFHYFASPQASILIPDAEALRQEITVAAGYYYHANKKHPDGAMKFAFVTHLNEDVPAAAATVAVTEEPHTTPIFLLYKMSYSFNIGHQIWDDILSLFTMLEFFGYAFDKKSYQPVPMQLDNIPDPFYRCNPPKFRWDKCGKMIGRVMPPLSGVNLIHGETGDAFRAGNAFKTGSAVLSDPSTMVRLPLVIAGPGNMAEYGCRGECAAHWTGRLYRFRQWVLENIFGTEGAKTQQAQPASLITVSLPVGNTHSDVEQFKEIIPALQERFGHDKVSVVDFATLSWQEQAELTISSKILLTNHGGGSATSIFLQRGSTVVLFHTPTGAKFDTTFYDAQGYMNVVWLAAQKTAPETVVDHVEHAFYKESFRK